MTPRFGMRASLFTDPGKPIAHEKSILPATFARRFEPSPFKPILRGSSVRMPLPPPIPCLLVAVSPCECTKT